MVKRNYNLYDSLNIEYNNNNQFFEYFNLFHKDYDTFLSNSSGSLDLVINLTNVFDDLNKYSIENDLYHVGKKYLSGEKKYKNAKFSYELRMDEDLFSININANIFASRVMHHLLLDYIINLLLFKKGFSNLHCSGVVKNNQAVLFSGPGGSGKTSFALYCLKNGYTLLGDDRIFIKDSIAYPFLECPGIEYNNSFYMTEYLNEKSKLVVYINKFIKTILFNYIGALFSLKSKEVFPEKVVANPTKIEKIIFLQPSSTFETHEINRNEILNKLQQNQIYEDKHISKEFFNYSTMFPDNIFTNYIQDYSSMLSKNLPNEIDGYLIRFKENEYSKVNQWIDETL